MTSSGRSGQSGLLVIALLGCDSPIRGPSGPADSLLQVGRALYGAEEYEAAGAAFAQAVVTAHQASDDRSEGVALTELGLAEYRTANLDSAAAHQERALFIHQRLGANDHAARSANALGLVRLDQNRDSDAIRAFERAVSVASAAGDSTGIGRALGNLALPYAYRGDFARARAAARGLRAAGRSRGDAKWEANGLTNEAMIDVMIADPRPAIARLDSARRLYQRIAYRTGEQVALGHLASAYELTGDLGAAFGALDTALAIARGHGLRAEEAVNLRLLADLHARVGDFRRAVDQYQTAEATLRATGALADLGAVLRGAAEAFRQLGNYSRARALAAEALQIDRGNGERILELADLLLLARLEARSDRRHLQEATALADSLGTPAARIAVLLTEAEVAGLRGEPRQAGRAARDAALAAGDDDGAQADANGLLARSNLEIGALDSAVAAGLRAVAAIERLRESIDSDPLRSSLMSARASSYGNLVLALLRLGRLEEAFAAADRGRSRTLLEHLTAARAGGTAGQLAEGEELLRAIDQLVRRLNVTTSRPPRERGTMLGDDEGIRTRLADARARYEALLVRTVQRDRKGAVLLAGGGAKLDEIRDALQPRQALVEYLLTPSRLIVFLVTHRGLEVVDREFDPIALVERIRVLRDLWGTPTASWRSGLPVARALHRDLIAPIEAEGRLAGVDQLVVVPHGVLESLPFAALQSEATSQFLAQRYAITRLPSAAALPLLRAAVATAPPAAAPTAFAPFPGALPATEEEVTAMERRLPGTVVRLGRAATETSVRLALAGGGYVHLATHGVLNARNPLFSRVALAAGESDGSDRDGRLEVHEILGLTIRSPFVFFSGCETGATREWTHDPLVGTGESSLAQAVLAAGAQDVISTLWRIDDAGAAAFADRFYHRFASAAAAGAMAQAQRGLIADARFLSPYYWAGYILSGIGLSRPQIGEPNP